MSNPLINLGLASLIMVGGEIVLWARELSRRYNTWTTNHRERHSGINSLSSPEMREVNTRKIAWIFRVVGVCLLLLALAVVLTSSN
jgi:hypothetical protein